MATMATANERAAVLAGMRADKPIVLIDTSYFVFYRYYATLRWFTFRNRTADGKPAPAPERPTEDAEFMAAFEKQARAEIKRVRDMWGAAPENTVFCYDCSRCDIWRMMIGEDGELVKLATLDDLADLAALADEDAVLVAVPLAEAPCASYKATRVAAANFSGDIFPKFYDMLESGALGEKLRIASGASLEADDVVYGLVRRVYDAAGDGEVAVPRVVCISNDNDYLQLRRFAGLLVYNLQDKNLADRSCGCPEKDLLVKVLSGDKSDNIAPCVKGIGPKTALKMAEMDDEARVAALVKKGGEAALSAMKRNRTLVDFRSIPLELLEKLTLR